ncbi:9-cis-epoxycarotenoid dioxygenase [Bertholletia excelsa]
MAVSSIVMRVNGSLKDHSPNPFDHHQTCLSPAKVFKICFMFDIPKYINEASVGFLDALVDSMFKFVDQPVLPSQQNFVPVEEVGKVEVYCSEGTIPADFTEGVYIRNGPNPLFGGLKTVISMLGRTDHTWVEGEGMVHATYFTKNPSGDWILTYKNRQVQSETLKLEKRRGKPCFIPALEGDTVAVLAAHFLNLLRFGLNDKYVNNTNVFQHAGKVYTISENYIPHEIDIKNLDTLETWDVNGAWDRPFTSHPKKVPGTGELVIMGVEAKKPYYVAGVISGDGRRLCHKVDLKFDRSVFSHEIGVTQQYNVILDCPLVIDFSRLLRGGQ